jgi:GDPmannose 4,6-dehydratase
MWLMLQQDEPNDFVVATGIGATIRDFCNQAFSRVELNWEKYVEIDERYIRPTEVDALIGDNSKIRNELGWSPTTDWKALANLMVDADLETEK